MPSMKTADLLREGAGKRIFRHDDPGEARWRAYYEDSRLEGRRDRQVLRDAYLEILGRWAHDGTMGDVELLSRLQQRTFAFDNCYLPERERVLRPLEKDFPGSLLPVALFHLQAWQWNVAAKLTGTLHVDAAFVIELAERHAKSSGDGPTARREAADLLTYAAAFIWSGGFEDLYDIALKFLGAARKLEPDYPTPIYQMAMIHERQGLYRKAAKDFERLERILDGRPDVRLRSAIQKERRAGDRGAAVLDELAGAESSPDWVKIVALQERMRGHLDAGRNDRAADLAARARRQFPSNERLVLMDLELRRRLGDTRHDGTRRFLDRWVEDQGTTPRLIYLNGPMDEIDESHKAMVDAMGRRVLDLRRALDALPDRNLGNPSLACKGSWRAVRPAPLGLQGEPVTVGPRPRAVGPDPTAPTPGTRPAENRAAAAPSPPAADAEWLRPDPDAPAPAQTEPSSAGWYVDEKTGERFRIDEVVDAELQQIYVSPERRGVEYRVRDFELLDEGRPQNIVTFEQGDIPFSATLLLDASISMRGPRLKTALDGAKRFIGAMQPFDRARILAAADRVRGVTSFFSAENASADGLAERLDQAVADGGTALFDHLFWATDGLKQEQGRKVVILLSDGFDSLSVVPMESIQDVVRRHQIQVYWVRLRHGTTHRNSGYVMSTGWRSLRETESQIRLLQKTVSESGGGVVEIAGVHQVAAAFDEILADLRGQIAIGYYPHDLDGKGRWREVEVRSKRRDARLRHAAGYYDE